MARGRIVLRTLGHSRKFSELPVVAGRMGEFCQALYPLLIANADDFGRLPGDAFTVKHAVFPTCKRSEADFETGLTAIQKAGLIRRYQVDGTEVVQIVGFDEGQCGLHKRTKSHLPDPPDGTSGNVPEIHGRREGKGRDNDSDTEGIGDVPAPQILLDLWNVTAPHLPKATELTPDRTRHATARLNEESDLTIWREVFMRMDASPFCRGERANAEHKDWRADFDFALRPSTRAKVLEGKYDERSAKKPPPSADTSWQSSCHHDPPCGARAQHAERVAIEAEKARLAGEAA